MSDEINKMKCMILQNQKMIEMLITSMKNLETNIAFCRNKVIRYDNTKPLTPIEIVGHDMNIMKMIIDRISSIKERKNIELTCKAYYLLCSHPNSYIPLVGYEASKSSTTKWQENGGFTLLIRNEEIEINIPETFLFNFSNLLIIKNVLEKYAAKMRTLYIMKIFPHHMEFFENLNCFESIETVKFSRYALQIGGCRIFERCPSLKPHTLIANNDHVSAYNIRTFSMHERAILFPDSLKNIHYDCYSEDMTWLVSHMRNMQIGRFDNLVITKEIIDFLQYEEMKMAFLKLLTYFKSVNFYANDFLAGEFETNVGRVLAKHNISVNINIYFGNSVFGVRRCMNPSDLEAFDENRGNLLSEKNSRLLGHPGVYLNIKSLTILDWDFSRFYYPLTYSEVKVLSQDLSMMETLTTFEIAFNLIPDFSSFCQIFFALQSKLQHLRLYYCSKMKNIHFNILSEYCSGLKNLSLLNLKQEEISVDKIISAFKYLKALEVEFQNCKTTLSSAWENLKISSGSNTYKLKWPELELLHIVCNLKSFGEQDAFEKMEKETPRPPGVLFLRKFYRDDDLFVEIIVQQNPSYYDYFSKLFTKR